MERVHGLCSSGYPGNVAELGNKELSLRIVDYPEKLELPKPG